MGFVRLASILLGTALLYQCLVPTHLLRESFRDLRMPWPTGVEYIREREREYALTIPYNAIRKALLKRFPEEIPIGQDASVSEAEMWFIRVSEQLYPRRVAPGGCSFAMTSQSAYRPELGEELTRSEGRVYYLKGCDARVVSEYVVPEHAVADRQSVRFSVLALVLSVLSVLGWGALTRSALRLERLEAGPPAVPVVILCASFFLGLLFMAATWLQIPVPVLELKVLGALFLVGLAWQSRAALAGAVARAGESLRPKRILAAPELLILCIVLLGCLLRSWKLPLVGWDGRAIWLLHAKQMHWEGMMSWKDLLDPSYLYSHFEYPLLYPAWLRFFADDFGLYNERLAHAGLSLLYVSIVVLIGFAARLRLGRWLGLTLTFVAIVAGKGLTDIGFADGLLGSLFCLSFLCLEQAGLRRLGLLALGSAALFKNEGLYFSGAILLVQLLLNAQGGFAMRARVLFWLAPGVLHALWSRFHGLESVYKGIPWEKHLATLGERLHTIGSVSVIVLSHQIIFKQVLFCMLALLALVALRYSVGKSTHRALLAAALILGIELAVYVLTPLRLEWHVASSVDRLILHPGLLLVAATLLALRDCAKVRPCAL